MQSVELAYEDGPKENQIIYNDKQTVTYKRKLRNYIKIGPFVHTRKSLKAHKTFKKIKHVQIPRIQRSLSANMTDFITGYTYFKNIVLDLNFMGGSKSERTYVKKEVIKILNSNLLPTQNYKL